MLLLLLSLCKQTMAGKSHQEASTSALLGPCQVLLNPTLL
jgi:hypothetical protein